MQLILVRIYQETVVLFKHLWLNIEFFCLEVCRIEIRNMSGNIDEAVQDPKRHFDFQQLINKKKEGNIVLIDVREHSEINETGKLPDSIHIPCKQDLILKYKKLMGLQILGIFEFQ